MKYEEEIKNYEYLYSLLAGFECSKPVKDLNFIKIPRTVLEPTIENADRFNKIIEAIEICKMKPLYKTKSGGISIANGRYRGCQYGFWITQGKYYEVCLLLTIGCFRIQFRNVLHMDEDKNSKEFTGFDAWKAFMKECKKQNVNVEEHKISREQGLIEKSMIESPMIQLLNESYAGKNVVFENAHHIDFNSAHITGMCEAAPDLRPVFEKIYEERKKNPVFKKVLVCTWGYMQSKGVDYGYSHLSRAGMEWTNSHVTEMIKKLRESGRMPIMTNTDGIWYTGEIYHDENEGHCLGQWKNDHINCKLRIKSKGAYEFIEDGKYNVVVRGKTRYENFVPREKWNWGDIFKIDTEHLLSFMWDEKNHRIKYDHVNPDRSAAFDEFINELINGGNEI